MEWQPIETAPRDGRVILLNHKVLGEVPARWLRRDCFITARWEYNGDTWAHDKSFTGWRPLPTE